MALSSSLSQQEMENRRESSWKCWLFKSGHFTQLLCKQVGMLTTKSDVLTMKGLTKRQNELCNERAQRNGSYLPKVRGTRYFLPQHYPLHLINIYTENQNCPMDCVWAASSELQGAISGPHSSVCFTPKICSLFSASPSNSSGSMHSFWALWGCIFLLHDWSKLGSWAYHSSLFHVPGVYIIMKVLTLSTMELAVGRVLR